MAKESQVITPQPIKKEKDNSIEPSVNVEDRKVVRARRSKQSTIGGTTEENRERCRTSSSLEETKSAALSDAQTIDLLLAGLKDLPHPPADSEMSRLRDSDPRAYQVWRLGVISQILKIKVEKT